MNGSRLSRSLDKTKLLYEKSVAVASRILRHPLQASVALLLIAVSLEVAQYWPEVVPGGHVLSIVIRNLAYALLAAVVFGWLVVEVPKRTRERRTYSDYEIHLQTLAGLGPIALVPYRHYVRGPGVDFDSWDANELAEAAKVIASQDPAFFGPERTGLMSHYILAATKTQQTLAPLVSFMSEDVAHAVLSFPNDWRLDALQMAYTDNGTIDPVRDAHLVSSLLAGSRSIYAAMKASSPDFLEGASFSVVLRDGTEVPITDPELSR
ncbi:hypothetical protein [Leucobacter triazinivorans]|uniref:Uncharacterized protein n=1 Tax=Leucobacter triazinivorans TaxID=1784719 RepID=A0A4P6KGK7_9MICO|nr:hypothetical protein [Leucobacter triazinivorans]QBE49635.1 hypothetical protein EVS81_13040 [Leucobacter triazinivorans]